MRTDYASLLETLKPGQKTLYCSDLMDSQELLQFAAYCNRNGVGIDPVSNQDTFVWEGHEVNNKRRNKFLLTR